MNAERRHLRDFLSAYFHQDWRAVHGTLDAIASDYRARSSPGRLDALLGELERLQKENHDDATLEHELEALGSEVDPYAVASGPRDWLRQIRAALAGGGHRDDDLGSGWPAEMWVPRREAFDALERSLMDRDTVVVSGLAGTGKTSLALWFADRHASRYDAGAHVFACHRYLHGRDVVSSLPRNGRSLIVLDELDRLDDPSGVLASLRTHSPQARVIVTTRLSTVGLLPDVPHVALGPLPLRDVLEALRDVVPAEMVTRVWEAAHGHPLLLRLSFERLRKGASGEELLSLLRPRRWPGVVEETAGEATRDEASTLLAACEAALSDAATGLAGGEYDLIVHALGEHGWTVETVGLRLGSGELLSAHVPGGARFLFCIDRSVWRSGTRLMGVDVIETTPTPAHGEVRVKIAVSPAGGRGVVRHLHTAVDSASYFRVADALKTRNP